MKKDWLVCGFCFLVWGFFGFGLVARVQSAVDEDVLSRVATRTLLTGIHLALRTDDTGAGMRTAPARLLARRMMCRTRERLLPEVQVGCRATADPVIDGRHLVQTGWITERSQVKSQRKDPCLLGRFPCCSTLAKTVPVGEGVASDANSICGGRCDETVRESLRCHFAWRVER
jgi:hypothetical protein